MKTPKPEKIEKFKCPYCKGVLIAKPDIGGVRNGEVIKYAWLLGCTNKDCVTNVRMNSPDSIANAVEISLDPKVAQQYKDEDAAMERWRQYVEKTTGRKRDT